MEIEKLIHENQHTGILLLLLSILKKLLEEEKDEKKKKKILELIKKIEEILKKRQIGIIIREVPKIQKRGEVKRDARKSLEKRIEEEIRIPHIESEVEYRQRLIEQYSELIYRYFYRLIQKYYETLRDLVEGLFKPRNLFEDVLNEIKRLNIPIQLIKYNEDFGQIQIRNNDESEYSVTTSRIQPEDLGRSYINRIWSFASTSLREYTQTVLRRDSLSSENK